MHICKCCGTIRQHPLTETETNTREALTCNECGRYEVIERQLNKGNYMNVTLEITRETLNPISKELFEMWDMKNGKESVVANGILEILNKIRELEMIYSAGDVHEDEHKISSPMCHLIEAYILQRNGGVIPESLEEAQELFYPIAEGLSMLEREVA